MVSSKGGTMPYLSTLPRPALYAARVSSNVSPVSFPDFLAVSTCEARPHM